MFNWIKRFWGRKPEIPEHPHNRIRRKVDTNSIRARLNGLGWKLMELPIRKSDPDANQRTVVQWKIIAVKGEQSIELRGPTLDEAMTNVGRTLGVIAQE
jgi:hypothetical protein